jgi:hypothetical protein
MLLASTELLADRLNKVLTLNMNYYLVCLADTQMPTVYSQRKDSSTDC